MNAVGDLFHRDRSETRILDFADRFREKTLPIEVRTDRFTGRVARILPFRWTLPKPSHDLERIAAARPTCPFCPERLETSTPRFPEDIVPQGRIRYGRSTVIPNAFPYCRFCGVTIFAPDHYIPMDRLTVDVLSDAVNASIAWFDRLYDHDRSITYYAVNWNYMPTAGGSLFHPHFQVIANPAPTAFHARLIRETAAYQQRHRSNYWSDLIAFERRRQDRYLFAAGGVVFLASFSPGGIFSEVLAVFRSVEALADASGAAWTAFLEGLTRILACFSRLHLDCLNMTLLVSRHGDEGFPMQARIMPRVLIPPWGTSDVNYFEKGHDEKVVIFSPERLAEEIRNDDGRR
jgi:galactose-1-phosphate uridylyltransferase